MKRVLMVVALSALATTPARAYFELTSVGARVVALGPSAMSFVDDVSAYHWNPAALATLAGPEVLFDLAKPHGVDDLTENALAAGARRWGTGWAAGWHRTALADVYAEDQLCLSAGRTLLRTPGGSQIDAGATFRFGRAGFQPFEVAGIGTVDYGVVSKGSFDVGARWRTPWNVDFSWVSRDLLEPRYEFVLGSGGDRLSARQDLAVAFRWNRESTISIGRTQMPRGGVVLSAGLEILFFDVFAIRSGLSNLSSTFESTSSPNDLQYSGGFGVFHRGVQVDAAAGTSHDLGASYRVSLRVRPRAPEGR